MQIENVFPSGRYSDDNQSYMVKLAGDSFFTEVATLSGTTWTATAVGATLAAANALDTATDLDVAATGCGSKNDATVTAVERGFGDAVHRTVLTLAALPQTITNTTAEYAGTKIYTFPAGRILVLGAIASIAQTTTSATATTIAAGATGAFSLGTATASATSLTGTMVDLLPSTAYTASATINVQAAVATGALAASAQFDGTSTATAVYFNTAIATGSANGTQTISGTVTLCWINLGDY